MNHFDVRFCEATVFMVGVADGIELTPGIGNFKQKGNIGLATKERRSALRQR